MYIHVLVFPLLFTHVLLIIIPESLKFNLFLAMNFKFFLKQYNHTYLRSQSTYTSHCTVQTRWSKTVVITQKELGPNTAQKYMYYAATVVLQNCCMQKLLTNSNNVFSCVG